MSPTAGRRIFVLILFLAFFLRFWQASDLFVFTGDEEHQLSITQTIVENFHLEWVGVSSADTGFYIGPFWEYFGAFWLWLSRGDPAILAYVAGALGIATTILVYLAGKFLFSETVGLVASFLYATLPLIVYYDRKFWNPTLTSFTALALFFTLAKTKDSPKWWFLVALLYGLAFHVHLS
ncbi:MAG: ArnT family glycosyltransferase, partial [Patescibacteria group bacterium]